MSPFSRELVPPAARFPQQREQHHQIAWTLTRMNIWQNTIFARTSGLWSNETAVKLLRVLSSVVASEGIENCVENSPFMTCVFQGAREQLPRPAARGGGEGPGDRAAARRDDGADHGHVPVRDLLHTARALPRDEPPGSEDPCVVQLCRTWLTNALLLTRK